MELRSHISVRSAYFRQTCSEAIRLDNWDLATFRVVWRQADKRAKEWRRQATNRYDHATRQWSDSNSGYRAAIIDAGRGHLLR